MDIYEYAEKYNADYFDMITGYIYKIRDYNEGITDDIHVYNEEGKFIGIAQRQS